MADITNVQVGVCSVSFNGADLGHTQGGVTVSFESTYHDVMVDYFGTDTVVDKVLTGQSFTAVVSLAESTLANLNIAIPTGDNSVTGKLTLGSKAGERLSTSAAELVLHPVANAAGDRSEDVVMWKAVSSEPVELPYKVDEDRVFEVTFFALPDETKTDGEYLGLIGDSAAV